MLFCYHVAFLAMNRLLNYRSFFFQNFLHSVKQVCTEIKQLKFSTNNLLFECKGLILNHTRLTYDKPSTVSRRFLTMTSQVRFLVRLL